MKEKKDVRVVSRTTYLFGSIAFLLSWIVNHSFWWGVLHLIFGQYYIIYWLIKYSNIEKLIKVWLMT